ncbi:hypothetical protein MBANPS3_008337 [Mucor bainieri]
MYRNNLHSSIEGYPEKLVLETVKNLALSLPAGELIKPINETDLKVNYLNTMISPFINKDTHLLKYPEVDPKEKSNRNSRTKRPDAIFYQINQSMLGSKVGFGEVKSIEAKKKTRSLALDLYRLLHFAKDAMSQEGGPSQILLFQAIGRKITFYIYTLIGEAFYVLVELFSVKMPIHIQQIDHLTDEDFTKLCKLQHVLDNTHKLEINEKWKRMSLKTPEFKGLVANRKCQNNDASLRF